MPCAAEAANGAALPDEEQDVLRSDFLRASPAYYVAANQFHDFWAGAYRALG
jgi:hypothetical protein